MSVVKLYSKLSELLEEGETVFIRSDYLSNGSIKRELLSFQDVAQTEALLKNPETNAAGPIASLQNADGSITVLERFMAKPRLIILGGGHISLPLAEIAQLVDFDLIIYDDRSRFANEERFPWASSVFCDDFRNLANHITFGPSDFVVDVTRGHHQDRECLEIILAGKEPAYTGMIGSRRRVAIVMDQLKKAGFDGKRIERIHAPIGLKIGAQTPAEIAVSIMAQIIEVKRTEQAKTQWLSCDLDLVEHVSEKGFAPEAMVTVLTTKGSVPTEAGCKLGITADGGIAGTVGGGSGENDAIHIGCEIIESGGWRLFELDLTDTAEEEGMVCGGTMQLLIEQA